MPRSRQLSQTIEVIGHRVRPAVSGGDRVEVGVGGAVVEAAWRRHDRALRREQHEEVELAVGEQLAEHVGAVDLGREYRRAGREVLAFDERAAGDTGRVNDAIDAAEPRVRGGNDRPHRGGVCDVCGDGEHCSAGGFERLDLANRSGDAIRLRLPQVGRATGRAAAAPSD